MKNRKINTISGIAILLAIFSGELFLIHSTLQNTLSDLSFSTNSQLASVSSLDQGLIAYYTFNEGSGTTANDSSGNGNNGTLVNGPTWTSGRVGSGALQFDGVNDYVTKSSFANTIYTASFWFKPESTITNATTNGAPLTFNAVGNFAYITLGNATGLCEGEVITVIGPPNAGGRTCTDTLTSISPTWHQLTIRWNGSKYEIYLDGSSLHIVSGGAGDTALITSTILNVATYDAAGSFFNGSIDDVRIYNRALSSSEISDLYDMGSSGGGGGGGDNTPPVISNISVGSITSVRATINWSTDENSDSQVNYGLTSSYGNSTLLNSSLVTSHTAFLASLTPNTLYHFRVKSKDAANNLATSTDQTFTTSASPSSGETINAASCSQPDVQAAIGQAQNGDTVFIPAGTCTWDTTVEISLITGYQNNHWIVDYKYLTLQGAGADSTNQCDTPGQTTYTCIIDAVPSSHEGLPEYHFSGAVLSVSSVHGGLTRVTGITFKRNPNVQAGGHGMINAGGDMANWRLDHLHIIAQGGAKGLGISGGGGVIDHNIIDMVGWSFAIEGHGNGSYGDSDWADPNPAGTAIPYFIEDNVFRGTINTAVHDGWSGEKVVFRHNTVTNGVFANHGTETGGRWRAARMSEVYDNTFNFTNDDYYSYHSIGLRGGNGIFFNNVSTGPSSYPPPQEINIAYGRPSCSYAIWGQADATNPWDSNDPTTYVTGTHNGSAGATVLSDSSKNWTTNQWYGYTLRNTTKGFASDIIANSTSTITIQNSCLGSGTYANRPFDPGDSYEIRKVNAAIDQTGRGQGELIINGSDQYTPLNPHWLNQAVEPSYAWNNTYNGHLTTLSSLTGVVVENRDYYNSPMPGYTPYVYPHPLVSGAPPPNPIIPPSDSDSDSDGIPNSSDLCPNTPTDSKGSVNGVGCPRPKMTSFDIKPGVEGNLNSVSNVEIGKSNIAKVHFSNAVSLIRSDGGQLDIDANLSISHGRISLNSTNLSSLNHGATLTFYSVNISPNSPILRDGGICADCHVVSYTNNTLTFTVPGFSTYEIVEDNTSGVPPSGGTGTTTSSGGSGGSSHHSGSSSSGNGGAADPGCAPGNLFSTTTGARCTTSTTTIPGCAPGNLFSTVTGERCPLSSIPTPTLIYFFTRDLSFGVRGDDVVALQNILISKGYLAPENNTGYFGPLTRSALSQYQSANNISPAVGYFGPITRSYIINHP